MCIRDSVAAEAAKQADIIMILINDELQADMYKKDIEPNLEPVSYTHLLHSIFRLYCWLM